LHDSTTISFHHNVVTVDVFALLGQQIFEKLRVERHLLQGVHFPIWFLFLQFSTIMFKGNETPESAPGRQVFKIKME